MKTLDDFRSFKHLVTDLNIYSNIHTCTHKVSDIKGDMTCLILVLVSHPANSSELFPGCLKVSLLSCWAYFYEGSFCFFLW